MRHERVLVTGGSGLLGRHVVEELHGHCEIGVLDIKPPMHDVTFLPVDILDLDGLMAAVRGYDAVIHLAGIDDGNDFSDKVYFETNVQGAWNVLHAAEKRAVKQVVVASSVAALGIGYQHSPDYVPIDEAHPLRPTATYGLTKQVIETVCRSVAARGAARVVCLRPTLIVRPEKEAEYLAQLDLADPDRDPPPESQAGAGVKPYGALSATRTYVRSADVARCFRLALDYEARRFDVFNVSAVDGIGREETLPRLARVYGKTPPVTDPERYERDRFASVLDITRTTRALAWEPCGNWQSVVDTHQRT